ncbi:MAG: UTP--glucose-1-phosphate uridylyltransferase [Rhabdochlamydiaceae bacterium]|jgi:UDP-N-acetylglucosamine/UDP-N-acetylgalactosamine diphosphorylase
MTSPLNHQEIKTFLEENRFFGLDTSQVSLFPQEMLPLLDDQGHEVSYGPDGNGHSLKLFVQSGIYQKWKEQGVTYLNMIPIDNPLADPFDAELLGSHALSHADICIKAMARESSHEQVGILGMCNGKVAIQEYSEMPKDSSAFMIGNTGLFSFAFPFIEKIAPITLPLHGARKKLGSTFIWKCERFIFDLFPYANKMTVLVYPRADIYAPIKNASGTKSLKTAQEALLAFDQRTYEKISGLKVPDRTFELSPAFYYPTNELLEKWRGKELPSKDYID